jgi:hypothetical protein
VTTSDNSTIRTSQDSLADARLLDIATRVLSGQSPTEIAFAHGLKIRQLRSLMSKERFHQIYLRLREDLRSHIADTIRNERTAPAIRKIALADRSLTLMGEMLDAVRDHLGDVREGGATLKAAVLHAGVNLVQATLDRAPGYGRTDASTHTTNPHTTFNIQADQVAVLQGAIQESGLDLSDILNQPPNDPP